MPGTVLLVNVANGDRVKEGDVLVVLESMKMEIAVESPLDGVVVKVVAGEGRAIAPGQPVLVVRPAA